MALSYKT